MNVGFDIGAHRLKVLRRRGERLVGRNCRALFVALPDTKSNRKDLKDRKLPYCISDEGLVIIGEPAQEAAPVLKFPCEAMLPGGHIPPAGTRARHVLASVVESLLPVPRRKNRFCCLALPGPLRTSDRSRSELEFLSEMIHARGFAPLLVSSSMALILAELVSESFTGIGMTFGASSCEISLATRGSEIAYCSVPRGGNWIDEQLAMEVHGPVDPRFAMNETASVTSWKESFSSTVQESAGRREELLADWDRFHTASLRLARDLKYAGFKSVVLAELYRELVAYVLQDAARQLSAVPAIRSLKTPLTLVGGGGTARFTGFQELLAEMLRKHPLPVAIDDIRVKQDGGYRVARGCLIHADREASVRQNWKRAA